MLDETSKCLEMQNFHLLNLSQWDLPNILIDKSKTKTKGKNFTEPPTTNFQNTP